MEVFFIFLVHFYIMEYISHSPPPPPPFPILCFQALTLLYFWWKRGRKGYSLPKKVCIKSPLELFLLSMMSEIESSKGYCYTPLYENAKNLREKLQWRLLLWMTWKNYNNVIAFLPKLNNVQSDQVFRGKSRQINFKNRQICRHQYWSPLRNWSKLSQILNIKSPNIYIKAGAET